MYSFLITGVLLFFIPGCKKDDNNNNSTITDADGNIYHAVTIGTQVWMVENLKTTKYNDSTSIQKVTDAIAWGTLTTPAYCWYENDSVGYKNPYGALYNWYAVNSGKLCPVGWHVPSDAEWDTLVVYLGGDTLAGGRLKEAGTVHWLSPNTDADNSSGFTALPSGSHYTNGAFYLNGKYGWLWSSTESSSSDAWHEYMIYNSSIIFKVASSKSLGFSVRCIKD